MDGDHYRGIDANMLTPIALMTALLPGMIERGWGRVVNITSVGQGADRSAWPVEHGADGVDGVCGGTSRQVAPFGVTINNLLPGIHDTDRGTSLDARWQGRYQSGEARAARATIPARRYGTAADSARLRVFVLAACGIYRRAEYLAGRRGDERDASVDCPTLAVLAV